LPDHPKVDHASDEAAHAAFLASHLVDKGSPPTLDRRHLCCSEARLLSRTFGVSPYLAVFAALWMVVLTWKVYPQFKDTVRVDGRVVTLDDYIEKTCGEKAGTEATVCRAINLERGRRLVAAEQAKMLLLVPAPLILYIVAYLPFRLATRRRRGSEALTGATGSSRIKSEN
jgi:hypothetical protein